MFYTTYPYENVRGVRRRRGGGEGHRFGVYIERSCCGWKGYPPIRTTFGSARKATRLVGSLAFEGRVTLRPGTTFSNRSNHFGSSAWVESAKCTFTEHARVSTLRNKMAAKSNSVEQGNFFGTRTFDKVDPSTWDNFSPY